MSLVDKAFYEAAMVLLGSHCKAHDWPYQQKGISMSSSPNTAKFKTHHGDTAQPRKRNPAARKAAASAQPAQSKLVGNIQAH